MCPGLVRIRLPASMLGLYSNNYIVIITLGVAYLLPFPAQKFACIQNTLGSHLLNIFVFVLMVVEISMYL